VALDGARAMERGRERGIRVMDTLKNFLFTMLVGGAIVTGITYQVNRHNNPVTYTIEPRLVEMYEHENAYLIWVSDPVSRLFILDKRMGPVEKELEGIKIVGGASYTITKLPAAYTLEDPFLFEGQVNLPTKIVCRPALQGPQRGIAKLLYINAPRFDWVGCAVPAQLIAGTDYKETKPWEVSYIKREGWPDSPRVVMGEKGSKVKWWVQDGTWGRGVQ